MKAIEETIKFLEEIVIECEPNTGCGRCDDARKIVEGLKGLLSPINNDLHIPDVSVAKLPLPRPLEAWNAANKMDCGEYIEWHLEQERRGNAR